MDKDELLEYAWGIIANAGGGNWETQTPEWQKAAARWREDYFSSAPRPQPTSRPWSVVKETL